MRSHYWTCSKFADWIRGTTKLEAGTSEEWCEWETRAKAAYPIRWWLAEEGLDYIQNIVYYVPDKLTEFRYYINNRWISRSHALTAHPRDIKPGDWCDVGNRVLPCLFNELVDFVEIETAWHHVCWNDESRVKYKTPWWRTGWLRLKAWRCPEAGIAHLTWASELTNIDYADEGDVIESTPQALAAIEILELYHWWTKVYLNRPDAYEASGWSDLCEEIRRRNGGNLLGGTPDDLREVSDAAHTKLHEIEAAYTAEDEAMMIRLIKVRNHLWT
jgi:hypothetical protein